MLTRILFAAIVIFVPVSSYVAFAPGATAGGFRVVSEARISLGGDHPYLANEDIRQWDLMPNGKDLLVARLAGGDSAATTPLRLILEERVIPAVGRIR